MTVIECSDLTVELGGGPVLAGLDLRVDEGEKVAVSGDSGAGKSTLLKVIIGQHAPRRGSVRLFGEQLGPATAASVRSKMFYLPQEIRAVGDETVEQFLGVPFQLRVNRHLTYERRAAEHTLARLKLGGELLDRRLADLSGGERKRVGLARGLLLDRSLFLADEPTASVDEGNRRNLVDLLVDHPQTTVLAVTHDAGFMERASRHLVLAGGALEPAGG